MCKASSSQEYTFGKITVNVSVDGNVDKEHELCDYLVASAAAIGEIEALRRLNGSQNGKGTSQTCTNQFSFGDISINFSIGFELAAEVSNRTLNDIVSEIMKMMWDAYGNLLGHQKGLGDKPHKAVLHSIDAALGMSTTSLTTEGRAASGQSNGGAGRSSSSRPHRQRASSSRR